MLHAMATPQAVFRLAFSRASPRSASEFTGSAIRCFAAKAKGDGADKAETAPSEKPKATRKAKSDGPKKALSPFILFSTQERPKVIREKPELKFVDVGRELGERWRNLTAAEKVKFEEAAQKDKLRYAAELEAHKKSKGEK